MAMNERRPAPAHTDARTLLALLRSDEGCSAAIAFSDIAEHAWSQLPALATTLGVAPLLERALSRAGRLARIPDAAAMRLAGERRITALDNLRNFAEFRRVALALQARGIPVLALKGMHLAELVYRDISLRPMSDIDVLVHRSQVEAALAILLTLGYRRDAKLPSGYDVTLTEPRQGIVLEVHWGLAAPSEPGQLPVERIWETAVRAGIADAEALVMTPEFLLLHVCTHLAYHHLFAFDLRALCDIEEIVRTNPSLDWEFIAEQARGNGLSRGVAAALWLARDRLGTTVPPVVVSALGGGTLDSLRLEDALAQLGLHAALPKALQFSPNLLRVADAIGPSARIAILWRRLFLPRAELAALYGVPNRSPRILVYHAIRAIDLVRNYAGTARALVCDRAELAAASARGRRLAKWLWET